MARRLPEHITARLRLPLIAAPMLHVSGVELVSAACRHGVIGAFPTANARSVLRHRDVRRGQWHGRTAALEAFDWPGNIRQLENVMQQAVLLSTGPQLQLHHLPKPVQDCARAASGAVAAASSLTRNREVLERSVIQRALINQSYNRARAARALGISRVTLYKKLKKYGLTALPAHEAEAV